MKLNILMCRCNISLLIQKRMRQKKLIVVIAIKNKNILLSLVKIVLTIQIILQKIISPQKNVIPLMSTKIIIVIFVRF